MQYHIDVHLQYFPELVASAYASNLNVAQNTPITTGKKHSNHSKLPCTAIHNGCKWRVSGQIYALFNPQNILSPFIIRVCSWHVRCCERVFLHSIPQHIQRAMVQEIWWPVQPQLLEWHDLSKSQLHLISTRISSGTKHRSPTTILGDRILFSWSYSHSDIFGSRGLCLPLMKCVIGKDVDMLTRHFDGKHLWLLEVSRA